MYFDWADGLRIRMKLSRRVVIFSSIAGGCLTAVVLAIFFSILLLPEVDIMWIPDYPSAQQVKVQLADKKPNELGGYYEPNKPYKTVMFVTPDEPGNVRGFYTNLLVRSGWWGNNEIQTDTWRFFGSDDSEISSPLYQIDVSVSKTIDGMTEVKIERGYRYEPAKR
jgi:hypothetical protein